MSTRNNTKTTDLVQQVATQLAEIDFNLLNQEMAFHVSPLIEAVVNLLTIVYYHVETGQAEPLDFLKARASLRRSLKTNQTSTDHVQRVHASPTC